MTSSTIPGADGAAEWLRTPRTISRRVRRRVWHAITPGREGSPRGRAVEAVRRAIEAHVDGQRIAEVLPEVVDRARHFERIVPRLLPSYRRFVSKVAPPSRTTSLEVASFLVALCAECAPRRVLELGTGFASLVLRSGAIEREMEVWSIDPDAARLGRNRAFLVAEGVATERMRAVRGDELRLEGRFDLVVHELGPDSSGRLALAIERTASGGFVLLDGAHDPGAEGPARSILDSFGAEQWSLRALTRDCFGRHALLARR